MLIKKRLHSIFILCAAVLWGTSGIYVRSAEKLGLNEMEIVMFRGLFSVALLFVYLILKDKKLLKIKLRHVPYFICCGIFSIVLFNFCYYKTMSLTSLSVAAVLLYTAPFFVMIISAFLFRERITINKITALIVAFIGCCFVTGVFNSNAHIGGQALFFGVMTGLGYSLYTIFGRILINLGYSSATITFYTFLFAFLGCIPFVNLQSTATLVISSPSIIVVMVLMAIFISVAPYVLYTSGLKGVEPSAAPIIAMAEPVVAAIVGLIFYKEKITVSIFIGIVLVLIAVAILNNREKISNKIKVKANAKININLAITGRRPDGYHTIDTIMQSIDLSDNIWVEKANKITVECENPQLNDENNIAYKAASAFFGKCNINGGAKIKIEKNIPTAAGLGGGSADAAAVLVALNKLYDTKLSDDELCEIAAKLGADVPFFVKGGTMRSQGIGEILTQLKPMADCHILLVKSGSKKSTAEMYRQLDNTDYPITNMEERIEEFNRNDFSNLENSFQVLWDDSCKALLLQTNAKGVSLSGSGPFWFAIYDDYDKATDTFNYLKKENYQCYLTKPCNFSLKFE